MSRFAPLFFGPWRAVPVLSLTQILSWGAIYYTPVLMMPLIAADHGWSLGVTMGGLSLGILVAGLVSPRMGALVDRHGGHWVMTAGSILGAVGLVSNPADIYLNRGNVNFLKRDYDGAIADYDRVLATEPNSVDALLGRGRSCQSREQSAAGADPPQRPVPPHLPNLISRLRRPNRRG